MVNVRDVDNLLFIESSLSFFCFNLLNKTFFLIGLIILIMFRVYKSSKCGSFYIY